MLNSILYKQKIDPSDNKQSFLSIPLKLHCCRYWIMNEWECANMAFPFWRIYHNTIEGAFIIYQNTITPLTSDKIIVIPPNVPYSNGFKNAAGVIVREGIIGEKITEPLNLTEAQTQGLFDHFFIHFNLGMPYDNVKPDIYIIQTNPSLLHIMDAIKNRCYVNNNLFEFSASLLIHSFILQLLSGLPKSIWTATDIDPRIEKVIKFMDKNIDKKIENNDLAQMVNMATNSFARFFKQNTGETVQYYLLKRRIEKARLQLHHSNKSIDTIAIECGFCDRHHFSKIFKSFTYVSPAYYKKHHTLL